MSSLTDEIRKMTIKMENGPVSSQDVYRLLMLSMLTIDDLEYKVKFLNDKIQN